jgi:hypothetical protein
MKKVSRANKIELFFKNRVIDRLRKLDVDKGYRVIRFPAIFHDFSLFFHFNKQETMSVLKELQQQGVIHISPFNGVRILKRDNEGGVGAGGDDGAGVA